MHVCRGGTGSDQQAFYYVYIYMTICVIINVCLIMFHVYMRVSTLKPAEM